MEAACIEEVNANAHRTNPAYARTAVSPAARTSQSDAPHACTSDPTAAHARYADDARSAHSRSSPSSSSLLQGFTSLITKSVTWPSK